MNICFLTTDAVNPQRGGVERVTDTLKNAFIERGHNVFYCAMYRHDDDEFDSELQHFFPNRDAYAQGNAVFWKNFLIEKKINIVIYQGGASKKIPFPETPKSLGIAIFTVIHCAPSYFETLVPLLLKSKYDRRGRKPSTLLFTIKSFLRKRHFISLYKENASSSDKIILLSTAYTSEMAQFIGDKKKGKILIIPNPIPTQPIQESKISSIKKNTLLWLGRMDFEHKRPDFMLHIWSKLEARFPDWELKFVGDGDYLPKLKKFALTLGVSRVRFFGYQNPFPFYQEAAILCMTSAFEGFPMVLIEAASQACVPIAFESFGAAHDSISSGETGVLVPAFDTEKYAEELARLMSDHKLRERLAKKALTQIPKKFSVKKITSHWEKLFSEVKNSTRNDK